MKIIGKARGLILPHFLLVYDDIPANVKINLLLTIFLSSETLLFPPHYRSFSRCPLSIIQSNTHPPSSRLVLWIAIVISEYTLVDSRASTDGLTPYEEYNMGRDLFQQLCLSSSNFWEYPKLWSSLERVYTRRQVDPIKT